MEVQGLNEEPLNPKRVEWEHIQQVLNVNKGNVSATSRLLTGDAQKNPATNTIEKACG